MGKVSRRTFLKTTAAASVYVGGSAWGLSDTPVNVLIIKSDEHNPFFGSFDQDGIQARRNGYPRVDTPHLHRLAQEGVG